MPVQYRVQADVVDLRRYSPSSGESYLVDTNAWYWTTYSRAILGASQPRYYQATDYPAFILRSLRAGASLWASPIVFAELAHRIEACEWQIYVRLNAPVSLKEFRHNLVQERQRVVAEIEACWSQVESMAGVYSLQADSGVCLNGIAALQNVALDAYDILSLTGLPGMPAPFRIVSDDGDFCTVPNVTVLTANRTVLDAARQQSRLRR